MTTETIATTSAQELAGKLRQGARLVDVRTPVEFAASHVAGAELVPLDQLDPKAVVAGRTATLADPVYLMCRSGGRSRKACEKFIAAGIPHVVNVTGGIQAWAEAGLPLEAGTRVMSLERQVRIAAGSLVLLGVVLALLVNVWFVALSGFVGAGLVFAGITDKCGMALVLTKLPWNRVKNV